MTERNRGVRRWQSRAGHQQKRKVRWVKAFCARAHGIRLAHQVRLVRPEAACIATDRPHSSGGHSSPPITPESLADFIATPIHHPTRYILYILRELSFF